MASSILGCARASLTPQGLPNVCQINLSVAREIEIPWVGKITNRVVLLNIFDRTNLIRPPNGIGVFQSAYGRITVYLWLMETAELPRFSIFGVLLNSAGATCSDVVDGAPELQNTRKLSA